MGKIAKNIDRATLNIFIALTRKKAKEEIIKREEKLDRELERNEVNAIIKRVARTTRGRAMLIAAFTLGGIGGAHATLQLNEAQSKGINKTQTEMSIDAEELGRDINITNVSSDREIFINNIKVDLDEITYSETIEQKAENRVNSLETPEEVLLYLKELYAQKYNEENHTNISAQDVSFWKTRQAILDTEKAENGDKIIVEYSNSEWGKGGIPMQGEYGLVKVTVADGENKFVDRVSNYWGMGEYVPVYDFGEKVEQNESTILTDLGAIIDNGLDYYTALQNRENNSREVMNTYKQRFINAEIEYEKSNIVQEKESKSNEGFEIE